MRFEVPQFIEVEDKIIGPLTWKQFIFVAGGAGWLVLTYLMLDNIVLFAIFGLPVGALAGFLAFHKVNNRPFSIFLESFFAYMRKDHLYLWRKDHEQTVVGYSDDYLASQTSLPREGRNRLNSLAEKLEFSSLEK